MVTAKQFSQFNSVQLLFKFIDFINFHINNTNETTVFLVNFSMHPENFSTSSDLLNNTFRV